MAADVARGGVRVAGLGDDLDVGLPLEHQAKGASDDGVVVSEDDGDVLSRSHVPLGLHGLTLTPRGGDGAGRRGAQLARG